MDKVTEKQNPKSENLDLLSTDNILYLMNDEDESISRNVRKNIPIISKIINKTKRSALCTCPINCDLFIL